MATSGHFRDELAKAVERHRAAVRAIGHDGQHEAIGLPGLFSEMLRDERIATAELRQIRRHRDPADPSRVHPWLRDYQVAVDQGRGSDAVAILQEQDALVLYETRAQAMTGMIEEWDGWRRGYDPSESALIVHGPNSDVELVNELAQRKRREHGELGDRVIRAVDRDYLLRPGDIVAVRNAAYTFEALPERPRPKRVENGQVAVVDAVDPERDTLTLMVREPGAPPRLVEIDQARLRRGHAAGDRAAAVRLQYAMHSFPAQGATVRGTATLAGHWSQAKRETYVGDTRAVYRHSVHVAREDLGLDGSDEDRIVRYAHRISENRQRLASIRSALDPTLQLAVDLPDDQPLPGQPVATEASGPRDTPPTTPAPVASRDASREASASGASSSDDWLVQQLGPRPEERIAQERWEREAQRLTGLQAARSQPRPTAQLAKASPPPPTRPSGPTAPRQSPPKPGGPTVGR